MTNRPITARKARIIRALLKASGAYQAGVVALAGTACVLFAISSIPANL